MNKPDKNIDRLFQNEKNTHTELSKEKLEKMIQQLPSLPKPNTTSNKHSIFNLKNIMMISIPSIILIGALIVAPNNQENKIATNDTSKKIKQEIQANKTEAASTIENLTLKSVSSQSNTLHQSPINSPKKTTEKITSVKKTEQPSLKSITNNNTQKEPSTPTDKYKTSNQVANIGSQIVRPQSISNKEPISTLQAIRLKKLLYKNLINDGLIPSKNISVEIELNNNSIIVNGKKLDQGLRMKYRQLTEDVGSGKDKMIKMNPEYIKIGDFTKDGFKGVGVGRFEAEYSKSVAISPPIETQAEIDRKKQNELLKAEAISLNKFVDELYKDQDRTYKKSLFNGNQIEYQDLLQLHEDLRTQLIADKYISPDEEFVVFELGKDQLLVNLKSIDATKAQSYLTLISFYKLKRKDNRMLKMSKNTLALGDYQPGSFTGIFCELK